MEEENKNNASEKKQSKKEKIKLDYIRRLLLFCYALSL